MSEANKAIVTHWFTEFWGNHLSTDAHYPALYFPLVIFQS